MSEHWQEQVERLERENAELRRLANNLLRHTDVESDGETIYERDVIALRAALAGRPADETPASPVMRDALQALVDEQNGPPLERRKEQWQRAYDHALHALRAEDEPNEYTKRREVMNPPQSAAEGCEAGNLTSVDVMGLGQVHRAAEARPAEAAPPPSSDAGTSAVHPSAWYRGVYQSGNPNGPPEYDVDLAWGDDAPPGEGWQPLYTRHVHDWAAFRDATGVTTRCVRCGAAETEAPHIRRDSEWVLAMATALGYPSSYKVPVIPDAQAFRELFAAFRRAAAGLATTAIETRSPISHLHGTTLVAGSIRECRVCSPHLYHREAPAADSLSALKAAMDDWISRVPTELAELRKVRDDAVKSLPVLRDILRSANLAGADIADQMLARAEAVQRTPAEQNDGADPADSQGGEVAAAGSDTPTAAKAVEPDRPATWIPVGERMPPPHTNIWCLNRDGRQFEGAPCYGLHAPFFTMPHGDGSPSNTAPKWIDVTHWMPLPAMPAETPSPDADGGT